jgi:hypothetical protein
MSNISDEYPARISDEEEEYNDRQVFKNFHADHWNGSLSASNYNMTIVDVINGTIIPFESKRGSVNFLRTDTDIYKFFEQFSGTYRSGAPAWLGRTAAYIAANITHQSKPQTNLRVIGCSFKKGSFIGRDASIIKPFNHTTHVKVVPYTTDEAKTYTREHYRDRQHGICNQLITILDEQINYQIYQYDLGRHKAAVVFCNYMLLRHTIKQGQLPAQPTLRLSDHNETATPTAIAALNADIAEVENADDVDRFIIHQIFMNKQILIDLGVPVPLNSELDIALEKYSTDQMQPDQQTSEADPVQVATSADGSQSARSDGQSKQTYNPLHHGAGRRLNRKKKNKKISRNKRTKQIKRRNIKKRTNTKKKSKKIIRTKRVSRKMKRSRMRVGN